MIRMLTAFTEEIDFAEAAASDVLEQLASGGSLLKNSVGIMHCTCDFDESDVVREICKRVPFDVVGCTSLSVQGPGGMGQLALSMTVLTSDETRFVSGVSAPVSDDLDGTIAEAYERVIGSLTEKPSMIMPFIPFMLNIGGDEFVEKIDELAGGKIPAFGTVAITSEQDFSRVYTIYNGDLYPTSLVLLGLIGDVDPIFMSASVPDADILKQKAVVTEVRKNVLQSVNNMPAVSYLESIGLSKDGDVSGFESMPFVIKLDDGSMLIRACIGSSTQDGGVILCGSVPVGSKLSIAAMGSEDVVKSTREKVKEALERGSGRGMMMYSCVARSWTLGTKVMAEHEAVGACIGGSVPYHFVYSGGEIFPAFLDGGRISNQLQNNTMILCVL
ncbi:MAG: FIST C-terminal domain-containing protein [Synergistaceae bacterium]|nr:FIST C-terminal domain-containing protein [Synergistaceae bacterium]